MKKNTQYKPLITSISFASATLLLASCSGLSTTLKLPNHKVDYKNSKSVKSLEVPPDLTSPEFDTTYAVNSNGSVSAVEYGRSGENSASGSKVLAIKGMQIKRSGSTRWLEVQAPADALWPKLTAFWSSLGVALKSNEPRVGIMETEWAENRAGLPMDWLRRALGKVFQDSYDAGTRDKFKLHIERPSANVTDIFIAHRRAEEKLLGEGGVKWEMAPSDPEIEAEILNRLSVFLQGQGAGAKAAKVQDMATSVSWSSVQGVPVLNVSEDIKTVWLKTGVMLERIGMSIEGQDRADGIYKVVYRGGETKEKRGWFSRVFKGNKNRLGVGAEYQLHLSNTGNHTLIAAMNEEGQPVSNAVAKEILGKLKAEFER